jgi:hypothetical protein
LRLRSYRLDAFAGVAAEIATFGLIIMVSHQPKPPEEIPLRMTDRQKSNTKLIEDLAQQADAPIEWLQSCTKAKS